MIIRGFYRPIRSKGIVILIIINSGDRIDWRPIRSVVIRVITKSGDRGAHCTHLALATELGVNSSSLSGLAFFEADNWALICTFKGKR